MPSSKRPVILMGILLLLVMGYLLSPWWQHYSPWASAVPKEPPLPGDNRINGLVVKRDADGRWQAHVDYYYTGEPRNASLQVLLPRLVVAAGASAPQAMVRPAAFGITRRGTQQVTLEIHRPEGDSPLTTPKVVAQLVWDSKVLASREVQQAIDWPDLFTYMRERSMAGKTAQQLLDQAITLIDTGRRDAVEEARFLLERALTKDPQADAAYVELARVAMKTNWGPEGLHQAQGLLDSALQIRPDSVNAKILLGYVHGHQGRYKQAEALFVEAAATDTKNLWLWANWGELLAMQGQWEAAERKYREAITRPRTHDTYDRARLDAYARLLALLDKRKDLDGMEALHRQRTQEFGPGSCYGARYARFLLLQRGQPASAAALARTAVDSGCAQSDARETLGMAYYMDWAGATGPQREEALRQARVFLPPGPVLMYQLATSDRTVEAARQLVAAGESIDQRDNLRHTALAHALQRQDLPAARRLLRLGARADATIGEEEMPVALLPVINADLPAIRLLQQHKVDYSRVRWRGFSAVDHAKQIGDPKLLEALTPGSRTL